MIPLSCIYSSIYNRNMFFNSIFFCFCFYPTEFSLGLYDRIRGTYCDVSKCTVSWNHDNNAVVGGSSVTTINVREQLLTKHIGGGCIHGIVLLRLV